MLNPTIFKFSISTRGRKIAILPPILWNVELIDFSIYGMQGQILYMCCNYQSQCSVLHWAPVQCHCYTVIHCITENQWVSVSQCQCWHTDSKVGTVRTVTLTSAHQCFQCQFPQFSHWHRTSLTIINKYGWIFVYISAYFLLISNIEIWI